MGTRSLTYVFDGKYNNDIEPVVCMYRQFDGYPSGHGMELAKFLNSFDAITNGIKSGEERKTANGMSCLAAQLVANFKTEVGGFYLIATDTSDAGQDYSYYVYDDYIIVDCYGGDVLFDGTWADFEDYCARGDE